MKIGMLVNNLEVSGGYQKLVIRLAQQLQKKGHVVAVYTPKLDTKACYPNDIKDLKIVTIDKKFADVTPVVAYQKLSTEIDPDLDAYIIHDELSLIGIGLLPKAPKKVVWMLNNQLPDDLGKYIAEAKSVYKQVIGRPRAKLRESKKAIDRVRLMRKGLKRTQLLVTYDSFNKSLVKKMLGRNAQIVYAGADLEQFKKYAKSRSFNTKRVYQILSVGVVFPHRRYEDLIEAMSILVKDKVSVRAVIVGRQDLMPDYFNKLKGLTKEFGLEKHISFKNYIADDEMIELYKNSDVFAFINDGFTWGISVFEAVAAKLPVIITSNIGAADLIKNGQGGWVVPPRNPRAVADAISEIIDSRKKAEELAENAYRETIDFLSWEAYTDRMLSILK